ncbi:hypothetical protein An16g07070 [Aspergillus niger]|uniref:Uncharacterized protein n=2 Tax=Aspergillus niger TaxID=5061 RepID=A2R8G5_ASPNC|nr:hypothetical protein An16g07070 [Aspergillus niger]CAL00480.1 hypothetical protein An16g07070 [Aspergillus niger]
MASSNAENQDEAWPFSLSWLDHTVSDYLLRTVCSFPHESGSVSGSQQRVVERADFGRLKGGAENMGNGRGVDIISSRLGGDDSYCSADGFLEDSDITDARLDKLLSRVMGLSCWLCSYVSARPTLGDGCESRVGLTDPRNVSV